MHCTIDPDVTDGLKVITEIPDISLCMIEGRNGVGKSVAVQLLELISGSIPEDFVRRPALWSSMRDRIHHTSVFLNNLKDSHSIHVTFTPEYWPEQVPGTLADWLGTAMIDGKSATIEQCASLLSVTRISGDEDLEVTLRRRVETLTTYLGLAASRVRQRGSEIEDQLADLAEDLKRADPQDVERDETLLAQAEEYLQAAKVASAAADQRLNHLLHALENRIRLEAAGQEAVVLQERRDELVAAINQLDADLVLLETRAEEAEGAFAAEGDAQKKLADAERLLRHRRARLANLDRQTKTAATELELTVDVASAQVAEAISRCESELTDLRSRHRRLDNTSLVRDLIRGITPPLRAANDEIGDQTLVRMGDGSLTVSETLEGVSTRGRELADQPQPEEMRRLATQIDRVVRRQMALRNLLDNLEQYGAQCDRVQQAEAEAVSAAEHVLQASEAARQSREANQAVGATQEALTRAHAELATLQQQIGSGAVSKEDAEADLASALQELGLEEIQLTEAEPAARAALAQADQALTEAEAGVSTIRRRLTLRQADVDLVIERLNDTSRYHWLWRTDPVFANQMIEPSSKYRAFGLFRKAILNSIESAYEAANLLSGLEGIAKSFFDANTERASPQEDRDLVQSLRPGFEAVLGQRLREALNSDTIRREIFDGAEVISVQPRARQLTLRDAGGNESQRAMEAFSSGERAFAFTQARIADLEPSTKPNRLLVLDEFGAYVAADRLPDLATFLEDYVRQSADQVIVILPLHVNYESEIEETRGALRARYEERLEQIRDRDYCAVQLQ